MSACRDSAEPTLADMLATMRRDERAQIDQRNKWHRRHDIREALRESVAQARVAFAVFFVAGAAASLHSLDALAVALIALVASWVYLGIVFRDYEREAARAAAEWTRLQALTDAATQSRRAYVAAYALASIAPADVDEVSS